MGLLFKPRRKTPSIQAARSDDGSVKDLSDLLGSGCYYTEVNSLPGSTTYRHASPALPMTEMAARVEESCRCDGCSPISVCSRADRLRAVQVLEFHTEGPPEEAKLETLRRVAVDEAIMAVVICLSSCICAHLLTDAWIGLSTLGWVQGLTKTLKVCLILYAAARLSPYAAAAGRRLRLLWKRPPVAPPATTGRLERLRARFDSKVIIRPPLRLVGPAPPIRSMSESVGRSRGPITASTRGPTSNSADDFSPWEQEVPGEETAPLS